jgi:hypothetical protein
MNSELSEPRGNENRGKKRSANLIPVPRPPVIESFELARTLFVKLGDYNGFDEVYDIGATIERVVEAFMARGKRSQVLSLFEHFSY